MWSAVSRSTGGNLPQTLRLLPKTLFLTLYLSRVAGDASTLKFVQILFRHGDRNPNRPWGPEDPNPESAWPQGWGQLTPLGKLQMYQLGRSVKRRYAGFLPEAFDNRDVYVRSTGRDRALMSAQAFTSGLFPPGHAERWNPDVVGWQPVPVHSVPIADDWVMRTTKVCPNTTDHFMALRYRAPDFVSYISEHRPFIEKVTKDAGLFKEGNDVENVKKMWKLGGNLHIARRYKKPLPSWATDDVIDELTRLRVKKFECQATAYPRFTGGPFLAHLLSNLKAFSEGKFQPPDHGQKESGRPTPSPKFVAFSGHDSTIVFLLGVLGLFHRPFWPAYGASVFVELHGPVDKGGGEGDVVRLFVSNGVDADVEEWTFPGCPRPCPLETLMAKFGPRAVWSRQEFEGLCEEEARKQFIDEMEEASWPWHVVTCLGLTTVFIYGLAKILKIDKKRQ